ncbi:acyl-CoA dehydrogenase family protein [bacterium]|nr:acyl-CoA dehydrogenase family protein [bacterium]
MSPSSAYPPPERRGPPTTRGPTAAASMPFFFSPEEAKQAAAARGFADLRLAGEREPATSEASVVAGKQAIRDLAQGGLLALAIGPEGATRGGSLLRCVTREEIAYASPLADAVLAVQGLGAHPLVLSRPNDPLLARACRGDAVFGFAITEPDAGSDLARIATTARKDGESYVLSGTKVLISNAGLATHYTLFARTGLGKKGVSCFLVPAEAAKTELLELNAPHPTGVLRFEDARVPASALLQDEGAGISLALATLGVFRPSVGAAAIGMGRRALDEALAHVEQRVQFGAPLADNAQVQALLADRATSLEAARLLVYRAAWMHDRGDDRATLESAMGKLAATEAAQRACDLAVQLSGGLGVIRGRTVERLYRAVRALRIYEGASEVMRLVVAREMRERAR